MKEREPNLLIDEKSPYLLQHAFNPVAWYPWSERAFKKAEEEDKPVFLSIGYSTCHWCHVMERESFTDPEVAQLMNDTFINIKVDREERPDIDSVYMSVCQMMTGSGGWPLTIIMTPDKRPFFAATYIPKTSRFGIAGLLDLIPSIKNYWEEDRERLLQMGDNVIESLRSRPSTGRESLDEKALDTAYNIQKNRFDDVYAGFGSAPKFPTPHNLLFLLRYWKRENDNRALNMVEKTLKAMRRGGIYDHLGYGFHRYSTDRKWLVPHFEKMLYDQALLIIAYTETYQITRDNFYKDTAEETAAYVFRDLTSPDGAFYSAEDAESEGEEGKFYIWTEDEIRDVLTENEFNIVKDFYGVEEEGNFFDEASRRRTGANILHQTIDKPPKSWELIIESARSKLFEAREKRVRPLLDDKILTDWNGLMIAALSKAGRALDNRAFIQEAVRAAEFIIGRMWNGEELYHRYRENEAGIDGFLEDYAFLIWGLIELYMASFQARYLKTAIDLTAKAFTYFWDYENGGFYQTKETSELPVRRKDLYDGAIPSGNSVMLLNLVRLSRLRGNTRYEELAWNLAEYFSASVTGSPHAYTMFLCGVDFAIGPSKEVVLVGEENDPETVALREKLNEIFLPNTVITLKTGDEDFIPEYALDLKRIENQSTAYVCSNFVCNLPTTDPDEMEKQLKK
jgi:hypothetical protein